MISSRRGHDPARATLLAFGGAGGQLACLVAERLGMSRVRIPVDAGLLSARGLMSARFQAIAERQVLRPLLEMLPELGAVLDEVRAEAVHRLVALHRAAAAEPSTRTYLALRWLGQETPIQIACPARQWGIVGALRAEHERLYGYPPSRNDSEIELVNVRVFAIAETSDPGVPAVPVHTPPQHQEHWHPHRSQPMRSRGAWRETPVLRREHLPVDSPLTGPALILDDHATIVVETGWNVARNGCGDLLLVDTGTESPTPAPDRLEATSIELFTSRIESAALAMGEALQRTSVSVNVKERLDYSCAVLDARGRLVACAPHVPVHLGSLGVCVRAVLDRIAVGPGDVVVTNHPACGGSHLPDVTVVAGAFDDHGAPIAYVAARAHHTEIGGVSPGSMPPGATRLADEGVVIPPMYAWRNGSSRLDEIRRLLASGGGVAVPSRAVEHNLADLAAAIAACRSGVTEIGLLARRHGRELTARMMDRIQQRAAAAASQTITGLGALDRLLADEMDDGSPLRVRISTHGGGLRFDFTGSAPVHPANLNATPAIVQSCLVYIMRVLVGRDLPLNEGLMQDVALTLPDGMLNPPFDPSADPRTQPAVVGGNVETSQRLVNLILHGLGLCAESQGTMNNVIFGDARSSYYETICGGAGAGPHFDGASAVHTHMTNTRITDPEILERRYPVRLERFAIRRGSGGAGRCRGGDGVERVIRFLAPMRVSVLTQRRTRGPRGLDGGGPGAAGSQRVLHADGSTRTLNPCDSADVDAGDALVILTPGGGGAGRTAD